MKLNADIIYDNLSQSVMMESYGHKKKELTLKRPEFYNGLSREFKSNHIYISLVDRLHLDPVFGDDVVVISVGGNPPITYLVDKCVCFSILDNTDLLTIFNLVQQIFDKYDDWDTGLQNIIDTTGSIKEIVELSFTIFGNPIIVLDPNFRYLAYSSIIDTQDELANYRPDKNGTMLLNSFSKFDNSYGTKIFAREPLLLSSQEVKYFIINLFEKNDYAGSLTIPFIIQNQRQSDIALAQYLAKVIENSLKKNSTILSSNANILKRILQDLLNCFPIDSTKMHYLKDDRFTGKYICIKMFLGYRSNKVPVEYICNHIESYFSGCVAFEYESVIVTFINLEKIFCDEKILIDKMKKLLQTMNLKAGASHSFTDLSMARLYYRQACIAFEMGSSINLDHIFYKFDDYVLMYMMSHCMGEFPIDILLTNGVCKLIEHDLTSDTNYLNTLRTYLNNNMNITKTAKDLYVHRSTFLERLKRIKRLLQIDLEDPDQRLRLLVALKIIETNEKVKTKINNIELIDQNGFNSEDSKKLLELESIYKENP
ncbi:MAG: PucR family transcriptional regulator [Eubacteriaceae bacterium]